MTQTYTYPLAVERLRGGNCPECGGAPFRHDGGGGPNGCVLTDNGVADRINAQRTIDAKLSADTARQAAGLPDPNHRPTLYEIAETVTSRGLPVAVGQGFELVIDGEHAPALLRLSEYLLRGGWDAHMMTVELRTERMGILALEVVRTREQAFDWMTAQVAQGRMPGGDSWFVLDQSGPEDPAGLLRSKYTVVDGQVISQGWE